MKLSVVVIFIAGCFFAITIASMVAQYASGQAMIRLLKSDNDLRTNIVTNQTRGRSLLQIENDKLSHIVAAQQRAAAHLERTEKALEKTRADTENQLLEIQHHVGSLPDAQGHPAFGAPRAQVLVKADVVKALIVAPSPIATATSVPTFSPSPKATATVRPALPVFTVAPRWTPPPPTPVPTVHPTATPTPNPCHTFLLGKVCTR